uniref:lipopolysaccharide heptosyltransferase I n=1 Tax=Polynucleobacter sp. TaxID=2029855 RepID=UPI0040479182
MSNSSAQSLDSPKILLVKLSSLGDVLHNLPIVWDLRSRLPHAQIDWVVEEAYVHLLEPLLSREGFAGIHRIIPFGLRRWKKKLLSLQSWKEFFAFRRQLQQVQYDLVIETQGLLKSALVCALASKVPNTVVAGLANATEFSGYEPIARYFYTHSVVVPVHCHAVDRSRRVMCSALGWPLIERNVAPKFYTDTFISDIPESVITEIQKPYVLFFHSTARAAKRWSNANWIELGAHLAGLGYQIVLPWGGPAEKVISKELANSIPNAVVPRAFSIEEAYSLIAGAALTVGVDTGLTHLAAVLNKPTIELYCDSPLWKTEGYWSEQIRNLGDMKSPPKLQEAITSAVGLLKKTNGLT